MTMNYSPNFTNKNLYLKKIRYDNDDFESWFISANEVTDCLKQGFIPQIKIADLPFSGPKIAVILGQEKHPDRKIKDYSLHPDYARAIIESGGYPIFIAYDKIDEQLAAADAQGIFLIGGMFNSPSDWYEEKANEDIDNRGQAYLTLLDYAKKYQLPVLGICAGMQMLAGTFGAKLQKGINNGKDANYSHKQNGEKIAHKVLVQKDSLLFSIIKQTEIMTNSSHNESVRADMQGNNKISAFAEDGIVEAIEPINGWNKFLLGVQWHPERLLKYDDKPSAAIFKAFIESTKND